MADVAPRFDIPAETLRGNYRNYKKRQEYLVGLDRALKSPQANTAYMQPTSDPQLKPAGSFLTETVLSIPDLHCPFQHQDALEFLKAVRDRYRPTKILCLGDEIDAHAFSRYPKDPNGLSPGDEISKAREALYPFYREFPNVMVCESNHTVRGHKLAFQAGLPQVFLSHISVVLNAPDGWVWKNRWIIDDVVYMHGDAGKSGAYAHINYMKALKKSVVIGHIHSYGGVNYEGALWGMNAGCLIDHEQYCFSYAKNMPIPVSLGCGLIMGGKEAHFIPMHTDEHGRWTGKLHG